MEESFIKIMVCGKGGSGKSAVTVLAARVLSKSYRVYVVDSDESNALLPRMLGAGSPSFGRHSSLSNKCSLL